MKKYLLLLSDLELGGAERQAINFARYLKEHGREVTLCGLANPGAVMRICDEEKIPCIMLPEVNEYTKKICQLISSLIMNLLGGYYDVRETTQIVALSKYIRSNKFDVCISYCARANTILGCTNRLFQKNVYVWFQRDAGIFDNLGGYQKIASRRVDHIFANGISGREWIKEAYGLEAKLIYNGVTLKDAEKTTDEWRAVLGASESEIICTMVANLSSAKDHLSLLKAWKILQGKEDGKNLLLVFAGRFDDQAEILSKYVQDNNLCDKVRFLGQVMDITGLLGTSNICVFGAISEGSPNGVIEAAQMRLPVVATDLPEIREVLAENNYEYLFPKGNIELIAENVLKLACNADIREQLGEENRKKAVHMFSAKENFDRIISIVEQ